MSTSSSLSNAMIRKHFHYKQTIATILADKQEHVEAAIEGILSARQELERYIAQDPFFAITYSPYTSQVGGKIIQRMSDAAARASVGPMAAVAGAIAWEGVEAMQQAGAQFGVIDNGGDIAMITDRELRIGIHAGTAPASNTLAFIVPPQEQIFGVCTSSATVGPSISFGVADAVTVFSNDVAAADAWATAICNELRIENEDILHQIRDPTIHGVFTIIDSHILKWGTIPPIVPAHVNTDLITKR